MTTTTTTTKLAVLLPLLSGAFWRVNGLDITLRDVICDQTRPIYAEDHEISLECDGGPRCTFGSEAMFYGRLRYNQIENIGLDEGYVFVSADLSFLSLDYDLMQYLQVPICGDYLTAEANDDNDDDGNQQECPADGIYNFQMPYVLPSEENKASWIATGWNGKGEIFVYSEANNQDSLIGHCQLYFSTAVSNSGNSFASKFPVPSAMITTIVVLAFVSILVLSCLYRMIRDIAFSKKKKKTKKNKLVDQTDEETFVGAHFTQMKD